jgi:hypothetical protein
MSDVEDLFAGEGEGGDDLFGDTGAQGVETTVNGLSEPDSSSADASPASGEAQSEQDRIDSDVEVEAPTRTQHIMDLDLSTQVVPISADGEVCRVLTKTHKIGH